MDDTEALIRYRTCLPSLHKYRSRSYQLYEQTAAHKDKKMKEIEANLAIQETLQYRISQVSLLQDIEVLTTINSKRTTDLQKYKKLDDDISSLKYDLSQILTSYMNLCDEHNKIKSKMIQYFNAYLKFDRILQGLI